MDPNQDHTALTLAENSVAPYGRGVPASSPFAKKIIDPTKQISEEFSFAFDSFNERLFANRLRRCLVTLQRHRGWAGYFAAQRYETRDGTIVVDEIALNPEIFHERSVTDIFATLVHEQVHALQFQYGHPSSGGYHNKEWGDWMERIGLIHPIPGRQAGGEPVFVCLTTYNPTGCSRTSAPSLSPKAPSVSWIAGAHKRHNRGSIPYRAAETKSVGNRKLRARRASVARVAGPMRGASPICALIADHVANLWPLHKATENIMSENHNDTKLPQRQMESKMDTAANDNDPQFHQDILRGASEIALFLLGSRERRRAIYHLAASSNMGVFFKLGSTLCARRSTLKRWVAAQESKRRGDNHKGTEDDDST